MSGRVVDLHPMIQCLSSVSVALVLSKLYSFFFPSFQETVAYFGLKPKPGDKEVSPDYVFLLWFEFCNDFKNVWKRESKTISQERWVRVEYNVFKL